MSKKRYLSIDIFRGFAIALMVFGNTSLMFEGAGGWADHAEDFGLTPGDLVAPMFIFAIAMTYRLSFDNSVARDGRLDTYVKFFRRYTCLAGVGFLFHPIFPASERGILFAWGTLAAIGFAGLLTLFVIRFPRFVRLLLALLLLALYQWLLGREMSAGGETMAVADLNLADGHGGLIGGLAWFAMMLLGTAVVHDVREQNLGRLFWYGLVLTLVGVGIHLRWQMDGTPAFGGISKERMTPAYVFVGVGFSTLLYWLIWYLYDIRRITKGRSRFFRPLAKNSFFLFLAHPFLIVTVYLILPRDVNDLTVGFVSVVNTWMLWRLAVWMDQKKYYVVL